MMNVIKRNIPNAITCLNVLAGTLAIIAAIEGTTGPYGLKWAWIMIGIAAVADFCDGLAARTLKAYSSLGKELDSLCDLVSFGVAPAILVFRTFALNNGESWIGWLVPIIAVCGALRLARFNVAPENNDYFTGLPIPANAIFWIGFSAWNADLPLLPAWMVAAVVVLFPLLMVSPLKLFTLKFKTWGWRGNAHRWLMIAATVVFCVCLGVAGLMWAILFYIALSLLAGQMGK